jgi:RNA polymerase sigma-70 factor (ECF subfamily)
MGSPGLSTNTLLLRLQQEGSDADAWEQFALRYGRQFYQWCRARGLQDADAAEVTQEVFLRVVKGIATFERARGSARTWLFTILRNCLAKYLAKDSPTREGKAARLVLESQEAAADLEQRLNKEFDLERLEIAENNVRSRLRGNHTWLAYELTCKEGLSDDAAAKQLGIPRPHVIRYRSRLIKMLQEEVGSLEDREEGRRAL